MTQKTPCRSRTLISESDRRDSNPRSRPWQGRALPTTPLSHVYTLKTAHRIFIYSSLSQTLWLNPRPISKSQLNVSPRLHLSPIYLVVFKGSYRFRMRYPILRGGFTLRCLQRLSRPDLATRPWGCSPTWLHPVVSPSRSSRTKDSSSQISYARAG